MRPLRHADHRTVVETEGWDTKSTARSGSKTGDHWRYTLRLATGVVYTRVLHGSGEVNDPRLVAKILRDQLQVSEDDFYACVNDGILPPRPATEAPPTPKEGLDAKLVMNLIRKVGLTQQQVAAMSKAEAVEAWTEYLEGRHEPGRASSRAARRSQ
jgi:hypothetical protein